MEMNNIRALLRLIKGKWTLSVLAELGRAGRAGLKYSHLLAAVNSSAQESTLSTQQLSTMLVGLRERGLVVRQGPEQEYQLTDVGWDLVGLLTSLDATFARFWADSAARGSGTPPTRTRPEEGYDGMSWSAA
ncbi:MAG TPA: winged helix-turn-helix transcriptional regulator [Actinocrinis sp.]|jgi:DNA-binding HxlR family transcriptional regulator|nr:winged helix-turn-helix transcriptional regulator [Actinocrinis sp.]